MGLEVAVQLTGDPKAGPTVKRSGGHELLQFTGDQLGNFFRDRADVLARTRYMKPAVSFREIAQYSNLGYFVAGEATGKQAGMSWDDVVREHAEIYNDNALTDEVNRMCLADSRLFLPGLNLNYTDRSSMAASVEVRTPFVDPVVARAAFAIPGHQKIVGRQAKVALKKAAGGETYDPDPPAHASGS